MILITTTATFQLKAPTKVITMSGISVEDTTVWVSLFQASLATLDSVATESPSESLPPTKSPVVAAGSITTSNGPTKTVLKIEAKHDTGNKTSATKGKSSAGGSFSFNILKQFTSKGEKPTTGSKPTNVYVCDESVQESNEPRSPTTDRVEPTHVHNHQQVLAGQVHFNHAALLVCRLTFTQYN